MNQFSTSITYDETTKLVMMTLRGKISAQDVISVYKIANEYAKSHDCTKVLIDVIELEHQFAAIDIVNIMPSVAHYLNGLVVARVVGFKGFMHDLFLQKAKRFDVVAENFDCFKQAKQWLGSISSPTLAN
ncbi:hypothetical protein [Pseudoalteromonas xiamenensis]|uniref:Uncharacterized protein n=1 Tax=Pseudoalteromonas xiamenensis TaxID=882626 RepID=A0A975HME9_9GAMM|nr:hypothetical protein [Pseudoalteromonas xiamenensis]QTH73058.1 hypothetical protein J5O05_19775 [Pseudoalteromonas xiamenensis]